MRDLMIERIDSIKTSENGFDKHTQKWKYLWFGGNVHFSDVDYEALDDRDLFIFYNRVIVQCHKQY